MDQREVINLTMVLQLQMQNKVGKWLWIVKGVYTMNARFIYSCNI